ncbi:MAG: prolipoprotein diacylglyceryl transferase [Acidimicrobiia bacterium]|nr:prolipoprotein diacylglyceryl transferase [Acidimicrobiia bacterium]
MMASLVASIPSPSDNQISLGPIDLRAYGFLIALGVLAGVWLSSRRLARDGYDPEIIPNMALWVLPAAIIGARAYFVLTNWGRFSGDLASAFRVWEGGLGIPGGVALGAVVGVWWLRRNDVPLPPVFTAVALGLPLGQIIGRFGNWFNQELYGRPTDLPWGLEIDEAHRLSGYESNELFHPTFAYEILWNIALLAALVWIDRKKVLRPGALFAVYLIGYGIGRILIETVRIDPVNSFLGVRLHIWAMIVFIVGALIYLRRYGWAGSDAMAGETDRELPVKTKPQAPLARPKSKNPEPKNPKPKPKRQSITPASMATRRARGSDRAGAGTKDRANDPLVDEAGDSGVTVKDADEA